MGIRSLNKFLHVKCPGAIQQNVELKNMNIAIDAYIYMYKFLKEDILYEGLFRMCNILKANGVKFVFVFDGKPPEEKADTLEERQLQRDEALFRFNQLRISIREETSPRKVVIMKREMEEMHKRSLRLKHSHVVNCKKLLTSHGVSYIQSVGEADNLCAYLCKIGVVDAVMSDDMDMFVYGVPRVIRNWEFNNKCQIYETDKILNLLFLNHIDFQVLCILVGSDYKKLSHKSNADKMQSQLSTDESQIQVSSSSQSTKHGRHDSHTETMFQVYHKWISYKHKTRILNYADFIFDNNYDINIVNTTLQIFQRRPEFRDNMVVKGAVDLEVLSHVMKKANFMFVK